jgi:16S rRNA processing protein RimM
LSNFISIAKIIKVRGVRGEVAAELLTDFPERFEHVTRLRLLSPAGEFDEELEDYWFHKNRVILKFVGRDRPHEVDELVGCEVRIPESERFEVPEGVYYDSDLEGCRVVEIDGRELGVVDRVERGGPASSLVVLTSQETELMIPFVSRFVHLVDIEVGLVKVELPPGLEGLAVRRPGKGS